MRVPDDNDEWWKVPNSTNDKSDKPDKEDTQVNAQQGQYTINSRTRQ